MKKRLLLVISALFFLAICLSTFRNTTYFPSSTFDMILLGFVVPYIVLAYVVAIFIYGIVLALKKKYSGYILICITLLTVASLYWLEDIEEIGAAVFLVLFIIASASLLYLYDIRTKKIILLLSILSIIFIGFYMINQFYGKYEWSQCEYGYFGKYPHGWIDASGTYYDKNGKETEGYCGFWGPYDSIECKARAQKIGKCTEVTGIKSLQLYLKTIGK
jgi:hypothetical protein